MKTGTVKFYNSLKGYGFIKIDDSDQEVFVHSSGLIDSISKDDRVEFDTVKGRKGMNAVLVRKIK